MKIYSFETTQEIPLSISEAWDFLSSPANLKKITPPEMGFEITSDYKGEKMYAGQIISYIVKPLAGIPMRWVTEITHVAEPRYFVDEQRFGPYAMWHHKHFIEKSENGVIMRDVVHYAIPMGIIGQLLNTLVIRKKIKAIFDYRFKKLEAMFGIIKPIGKN
jgi:ligand-binding SRPBCC domain-containing protein